MNETIKTIQTRRSIRSYKPEQFPNDDLQQILNAGLYAPSARNGQPWHFVVVRSHKMIAEITVAVKAATARMPDNPYKNFVGNNSYTVNFNAPTFIIVSANPADSPGMAAEDCSLALGNMFLAAHSLGIGSCWVNQLGILNDEPGFRNFITKLGVPQANRIYGCASFGYAANPPSAPPNRKENNIVIVE
ncbi:MAG: nitroreductase family protein [Planctomycetaceae bacterium]|jgi:nitroreductase|nr:nitroreductase family protein [Planctomycetaceae bacterium]